VLCPQTWGLSPWAGGPRQVVWACVFQYLAFMGIILGLLKLGLSLSKKSFN